MARMASLLIASTLLLPAAAMARTTVRDIDTSTATFLKLAAHNTCANGSFAGAETLSSARVPRLGKVIAVVKASWDWASFNADHPAALVNVSSQTLEELFTCTPFTADATVRLTRASGGTPNPSKGEIIAEITGGSVYEVVTPPDPRVTAAAHGGTCPAIGIPGIDGTLNESIINFEADPTQPDTPRGSITGTAWAPRILRVTGTLRTTLNSCTGESESHIVTNVVRP